MIDPHTKRADINLIKRLIPHRYPFLLLDRVEDMVFKKSARGFKNVTLNEPYFQGHFPQEPVMPGVLILETMAQTGAVAANVWNENADTDAPVYLLGVNSCKFRHKVIPGNVLEIAVTVKRAGGRFWRFHADAVVEGNVIAEADLIAMTETFTSE